MMQVYKKSPEALDQEFREFVRNCCDDPVTEMRMGHLMGE